MKIGKVHACCGDCGVHEYCPSDTNALLCRDARFEDMEEGIYVAIAGGFSEVVGECEECLSCTRCEPVDCTFDDCEFYDDSYNLWCGGVADYVESVAGGDGPVREEAKE